MKRRLVVLLSLLASLTLAGCGSDGMFSGTLVTSGKHTILTGETLRGVLVILDGTVVVEPGARITDSVYMVEGELESDGEIAGDITVIGGRLALGRHAVVDGDVSLGGGTLAQAPEAIIRGTKNLRTGLEMPSHSTLTAHTLAARFIQLLVQAVVLGTFAFLLMQLIPRPVSRVATTIVEHPAAAAAMGVLVGIVALSLFVLMAFTIILIPVSLLGIALFVAAVALGWVAFGTLAGTRLVRKFKWANSPASAAFLGTVLFMLVVNVIGWVSVVGEFVMLLTAVTGLGAVYLTRFGIQKFVPVSEVE